MITEIITFWGIVQGVGFRPTLSRIAAKYRMRGQVRNMGAFVQLIVTDEPERIDAFVEAVQAGKPRMADIMRVDREVIDTVLFEDFRIVSSAAAEDEIAAVPADVAVCDECFAEFRDAANPRYKHPFISCVNCGPRYTIMESLPYDRDTTTMEDFPMCEFCESEYTNPPSRRYHAQTVSCHNCGPQAIWQATPNQNPRHKSNEQSEAQEHKRDGSFCAIHARQGERSDEADAQDRGTVHLSREHKRDEHKRDGSFCAIDARQGELSDEAGVFEAIDAVGSGGVIALKGVGGYYFVCSPYDENAVRKLREIKVREYKPFAVMFASVEQTREYCEIGPEEEAMLTSPKCPIVLLERRQYKGDGSFCTVRSDGTQERKEESPFDRPAKRAGIRTACSTSPWDIPLPFPVKTEDKKGRSFCLGVSSTSRFIGAFLPSMALQYMLVEALGPIIMTSANISDLPIIKDDDEMFAALERDGRISGVLYNERRIVRGIDDSVVRVIDGTAQLIRRSKGWTPVPAYVRGTDRLSKNDQIFAAGADLKNAFALTKGSFVYMSQYIGDMDNVETERVYAENLASMREFFKIKPRLIACDTHPLYRTVELAKEYAHDTKLLPVQHHHAHVASVMAEHGLTGPVIGVAFDGTGYGEDGTIWGGEILICEGASFERFSHLRDIPMIGGDSSMRDGWKSAICRLADHDRNNSLEYKGDGSFCVSKTQKEPSPLCSIFDIDISYAVKYAEENDTLREYEAERKIIEAAVAGGVNTVRTSSMGRLFDAVASLLGICHVNRYEGECAVMLENAADRALRSPGVAEVLAIANAADAIGAADAPGEHKKNRPLCVEYSEGKTSVGGVKFADAADALALRFHLDVARAILGECRKARGERGTNTVCLSGGVFQNKILMERTLRLLRADGFTPYYNIAVPPNDGGIALGQAYIAMRTL